MRFVDNLWEMASELIRRTSSIVSTVMERAMEQTSPSLHDLMDYIRRSHLTKFSSIIAFMVVCNFGFVISALSLIEHPTMGLCVVFGAFTSMLHTTLLLLMFRKHPALSRIFESYSSQFLLGAVAGSTQVMSTLTLILSLYFGFSGGKCSAVAGDTLSIKDYECYMTHLFAMKMASFFAGLVSLGNTVLAYMFFVAGEDLGLLEWSTHQYESLDQGTTTTSNTASNTVTSAIGGGIVGQSYQSTPV
jgi:hypothetical protein